MPFSNRSRSSWFLRDWARACSNRASSCCRLVLSSVSSLLQLTRPTHVCMGAPRQRDPKSVAKAAQVGPHCGVDAACTAAQAWQERHVLHMPCWGRLGLRGTSTARLQVLPSPWCWTGGPHTSLLAPCPCCPGGGRGGLGCSRQDQSEEHPAEHRAWCRRGGQLRGTEAGWPVGTQVCQ